MLETNTFSLRGHLMAATPQRSTFGLLLAEALRTSAIRQSELARAVDCTPQYISQLVSGERPPSREIVEKIARVLKIAPTDLDKQYRKHQMQHFEMMQGIEIGYLGAAMNALRIARSSLLAQAPPASLKAGAGKA